MKNNKKQRAKGKSAIPYLIGTVISAFTTVIFVIALVISATLINGTDVSLDELSFEPFTYSHCAEEHLNDGRKTIAIYSNEEKEPIYINPDQLEYVDIKTIEAIPPDTLFFIRGKEIEGIGRVAH